MIYGDPFEFAVWIDEVPSWSYEVSVQGLKPYISHEGLISIIIDGKILTPKPSVACTLKYQTADLKKSLHSIKNGATEVEVSKSKDELYKNAHIPRYVDDFVGNTGMGVEIQCDQINNACWSFYLFKSNNQDRLIYSQDYGQVVHEKYMPVGTVRQVLESLLNDYPNNSA